MLLSSFVSIFTIASCTGYLAFPASRNLRSTCPQCATGQGVCGNGERSQWNSSPEPSNRLSATIEKLTVLYAGGTVTIGVYIMASTGGVAVLELCTDPGDIIDESCFKRLERDPADVALAPYLEELPTHIWLTTESKCTDAHTPSENNPLRFRFKIPEKALTEHGILRFNWQTSVACCAHKYLCTSTFDDRLGRFSYTEYHNGESLICPITPVPMLSCGEDCPNTYEEGCTMESTYVRNCADVIIRSKAECNESTCPDVREGDEKVVYPGVCSQLTGELEDCNHVRAVSPKDALLCVSLCQELFASTGSSYSFWCKLQGHCSRQVCAAAYSYGKCLPPIT